MRPKTKFAVCLCGEQIIYPCSCAMAHRGDRWRHVGTTYHRCGPEGNGDMATPQSTSPARTGLYPGTPTRLVPKEQS